MASPLSGCPAPTPGGIIQALLNGFTDVYVWREPGEGGDTFIAKIGADLPDILVITPPPGIKDVNELWLASDLDKHNVRRAPEAVDRGSAAGVDDRAAALSEGGATGR